jgi:hypothetical protein
MTITKVMLYDFGYYAINIIWLLPEFLAFRIQAPWHKEVREHTWVGHV